MQNKKNHLSQKTLKVIIPHQVQGGVFSNVARVNLTSREVVVDFAFVDPNTNEGILVSRVILTKDHAVELKNVLEKVLKSYEKKKRKEKKE